MTLSLSVCMTIRDEAAHLPAALASCETIAREIVVVDTGSRDESCAIAEAHPKVRLFHHPFTSFSEVKQHALDQATGDWVLVLDGDERVSPELAGKLHRLHRNGQLDGHAGFQVRRRNWMMGREMRSMGFERDYPLRLLRREGARYNDRPVHEALLPAPGLPVGRLEEPLEHHTFAGLDLYLRKIDRYTTLELAEHPRHHSTWHLVTVVPSTFLRYYVSRGGWRDGLPGLIWASLTALGKLIRDVKVWIASLEPPHGPGSAPAPEAPDDASDPAAPTSAGPPPDDGAASADRPS